MGLFDKLFGRGKGNETVGVPPPQPPSTPKKEKKLSAKEQATANGEPYVAVVSMDIDPNDINTGAFELDFNEIFVARLVKAGYMIKKEDTDAEIVDRWWTQICRNVALELYEQQWADPENRYRTEPRVVSTKDIGNGRSEVS
jgi:hypothetical protein